MEKLELKHLVGYLPYGLKIFVCDNKWNMTIDDEMESGTICLCDVIENKHTPILRPLSDLTKEIEVNREKFVPVIEYDYLRFEEISTFKGSCNAMKFIQARELELLYEWHFDIHGLIEKELAIDINTL